VSVVKLRLCGALLALVTVVPAAQALDPQRATSQYALTKWGAGSLPGTGVHAIVQTSDRYLWLGTNVGLVRFDGARFFVHDTRNTPSYGEGGVTALSTNPDGTLFFGTTAGTIIRMKDGEFTGIDHSGGTGLATSLLCLNDGRLWFSLVGRPIYQWDGKGTSQSLNRQISLLGTLAMVQDERGAIWLGTHHNGLVRVEAGKSSTFPVTTDVVQALRMDRAGTLWIGTPHGLLRMKGDKVDHLTDADGLSNNDVSAILEDSDGNLWVGTSGGGLSRLSGGHWSRFTTAEGLSDDDVRSLVEDHEGNLWVGTADGLNCLSDTRFLSYGRTEGLRNHSVSSIASARDGSVWVGTSAGEIARLRADGRIDFMDLPSGVGRERIVALHESRDGSTWVALDNGRLFRRHGTTVTDLTPPDRARSWKVAVIFEDEEGVLLYVTGVGLARVRAGKVVPIAPTTAHQGYGHTIHRARNGQLWMGSSDGLIRVGDNEVKRYSTRQGLPRNRVRWISEDTDGSFWIASSGGLVHFKDDRFRFITVEQGLPENYLRLVLDDGLGHLWVASMGNLIRLDKRSVLDVLEGRAARVNPITFDNSDGLRTTEAILSNNPGFRAADGRLWFATSRGASVVDPAQISVNDVAPPVRVERLTADGHSHVPAEEGTLAFGPGRGQVTIEYAALSFRAVGRVRFRYRLEGFDDGWVDAGTRRSAYYSNLPPGSYHFVVGASNRDGVWNGRTAGFSFSIQPPFYRTGWFYALAVGVVVALAAAAHRVRINHMRARFAAIIGERTRIARELHDTLAQGLAGTGIQLDTALTMLPDEPDSAREYVQMGRAMVRSTLAEVRRSIWVLRAQTSKGADGLGSTLPDSLRQLTEHSGLESRISVTGEPRELAAEVERNLLRIAHEAVTNALRHSGAENIAIELDFAGDGVHLRVRDDGRGFDPEPWLVRRRGDHFGLMGMSERVRGLGGELRVKSRDGEGTEVGCRLPYECRMAAPEAEGVEGAML
jgi:signal transduction histidine kinase/ligand-binding sensor domain-containing protein